MKTLLSVLVVLAIACPAHAEMIVFQEDFDGTAGTAVAGWNGWSGTSGINISSTVIDVGNSADWSGVSNWTTVVDKAFTPSAGATQYTLTATLSMGDGTTGNYSDLSIRNSAGAQVFSIQLGYGTLQLSDTVLQVVNIPQQNVMDAKVVLTDNKAEAWGRAHGDTTWTYMGALTGYTGHELSVYNDIRVVSHGTGGVDSILLTAIPEPTTFALLATGLAGLLCYAWKKRK